MAVKFVDHFGSLQDWAANCTICNGSTFLEDPDKAKAIPISAFRSADEQDPRCPCWRAYHAMAVLWSGGFPRGDLPLNWDPYYPLIAQSLSPLQQAQWAQCLPVAHGWEMESDDSDALSYWVERANEVRLGGHSLVLYGEKGTGKSALATALAKEFVKRVGLDSSGVKTDWRALYLVADKLYESLARGWQGKDLMGPAEQADLLVLDDLRMHYKGSVVVEYIERMHTLLQFRVGQRLPTILTVNKIAQGQDYESNSITEFLGVTKSAIPQRFGRFRYIHLTNASMRALSVWEV